MPEPSAAPGPNAAAAGAVFATTRWTLVLAAQDDSAAGREALEALCRTYWPPVYALVRRRGADPEAARDFTQEFFARLLSRDGLAAARRDRGRFRAFLAQSVKNFLADEWDRSRARKRGGGQAVLSLDVEDAEGHYLGAPEHLSPDRVFDRRWAEQLIGEARARLQAEYQAAGRAELLRILDAVGDPDAASLADEARRLELPLNTLKSHLRRARLRQSELIRTLVAETVAAPGDVDRELRHLLEALGR